MLNFKTSLFTTALQIHLIETTLTKTEAKENLVKIVLILQNCKSVFLKVFFAFLPKTITI